MTLNLTSINSQLEKYPEFLRAKDLIKLGLYGTRCAVTLSVNRGDAPPCIKLSPKKVIFPKAALCEWLAEVINQKSIKEDA